MVCAAILLVGASAWAAPESGKAYFESGVRQYNLGHFQEAIVEFEKAYNIDPAPILLFNIAQSHRQLGDKERALFFYRRYLEQAPAAGNKREVEQRMKDLTESLQQERDLKQKPPPGVETTERRGAGPVPPPPPPPPPPDENITKPHTEPESPERRWLAEVFLAPSFIAFSGREVDAPALFAFRVGGSYALPLGAASTLRVGAEALGAVLPYTDTVSAAKKNSSLWGFMLTARYLFRATPALTFGAGVGAGVIWWGGLDAGNPFTVDFVAADGPIPMPSFQLGARVEYAFGPRLFAALSPELLLSKTTSDGLSQAISSVRRIDVAVGVGYRF
jgi:Tetratricopeptide repeat